MAELDVPIYPGNVVALGNFTVNPLNGNQVIISSNAGRIFATTNQGQIWLVDRRARPRSTAPTPRP